MNELRVLPGKTQSGGVEEPMKSFGLLQEDV